MMQPPGQPPVGLPPYQHRHAQGVLTNPVQAYDAIEVQARLDRFNRNSFALGVPGMVLQVINAFVPSMPIAGFIAYLVGTAMVILGLSFYARSRGQSPWFGFLGLLSCLGLVALSLLPRLCLVCRCPVERGYCQSCGAPGAK